MAARRVTALAWLAFAAMSVWVVILGVTTDVRNESLRSDQASFLMQALSLAHDHDLSYTMVDFHRFQAFHWVSQPLGLYFQAHGPSWAFAKPYGYSLWLAPFLRVFGDVRGIAVGNTVLLVVLALVCGAILRLRFRGVVVPLTLGAFLYASVTYFGIFNVTTDLFEALLVACCLLATLIALEVGPARSARVRLIAAVVAMVFAAAIVSEKPPMLLVVGPLLVLMLIRQRGWWPRIGLLVLGGVALAVAVFPYLWYSSGTTWNPYGGDRFYALRSVPFGVHTGVGWQRVYTDNTVSLSFIRHNLLLAPVEKGQALGFYLVGRHSGLVMTMPLALVVLGLAAWRWRRLARPGVLAAAGIVLYILFYVILFYYNYFGGATSFGNRYFLQAAPIVLALAVTAAIPKRQMVAGSLVAIVLGAAMLWPHYHEPRRVLAQLGVVSTVQQVLPNETIIGHPGDFECPGGGCAPPLHHTKG